MLIWGYWHQADDVFMPGDDEPPAPGYVRAVQDGGVNRLATDVELFDKLKTDKVASLREEREAHVTSLYSSVVVADAALGIPSAAFKDKVISDRTQCALDLKAALDAVSAATTPAEVSAVVITWTITAGADPDAPEYAA